MKMAALETNLTCITCGVFFKSLEVQRQHYKSDWHRFNLKRKVASFPPVSAEEFKCLVIEQKSKQADNEKDKSMYCRVCRKAFNGEHTFQNHIASKKHKEKLETFEEEENVAEPRIKKSSVTEPVNDEMNCDYETDSEIEELSSDEWNEDDEDNPINRNNCLFCPHHSRCLTTNLRHMTEAHSFFVPDIEFCVNLKGMLLYLGAKIYDGYLCLWCNETGKRFQSVQAVQKHMIDKGHCKVLHEGEALAEYVDYYDYSVSYPDAEDHSGDEDVDIPVLDDSEYQLTLPSGATIGHRSLMRYYKQNLDPKKGIVVQKKIQQVLNNYRYHGYTPLEKVAVRRKVKDIQFMQKVRTKYYTQLGCKANKLQRHFRPQVDF